MTGAPGAAAALVAAVVLGGCAKPVDERQVPETGPTRSAAPAPSPSVDTQPPPTPSGTPQVSRVSPGALERGALPRVPWYDPVTTLLHEGRRAVRTGLRGGRDLWVAGDAYLLTTGSGDTVTVHRVGRGGGSRVLSLEVDRRIAVSADGALFAYTRTTERSQAVVVARTTDGSVVAQARYAASPERAGETVVAIEGDRLLLTDPERTWWWDFRDGSEQTVARGETAAVSLAHDRLALARRGGDDVWEVGPLAGDAGRWSAPRHRVPLAFSPGGAWLLFGASRPDPAQAQDRRPLLLSRARGGEPVREFDGAFGFTDVATPSWESDGAFLALAGAPAATSAPRVTVTWVRCAVRAGCEAASPGFRLDGDGSLGGLWVLARRP